MKLLDEIVTLLTNGDGSLNEALLKTKVLLRTIGQADLVGWVNDELTGYSAENVPPYRRINGRVLGNISNGWYTVATNQGVVLGGTPDEFREFWEVTSMTQALGVLERMVSADNGSNHLSRDMPPDILPPLSGMLSSGFHYERVWSQVELSQVRQLLIEVRSRLLDFILELRDQIGDSTSDKQAKEAAAEVDVSRMFAVTVTGDNATLQIGGTGNQQRVSNRIHKGDKNALGDLLRKNNVSEEDISALDDALTLDPVTVQNGQLGPAVKAWMKGMMTKAIEASWQIQLGVAGNLLTTALQNYYGIT